MTTATTNQTEATAAQYIVTEPQLQALGSCLAHLQADPAENCKYELPRIHSLLNMILHQPKSAE